MDFNLSKEQLELQKTLKEKFESEIAPNAAKIDEERVFPGDNMKALAEAGYLALAIPSGGEPDWTTAAMAAEELGAVCASTALCAGASAWVCGGTIAACGADALKDKWLAKLADGSAVGAYAVTDPSGGHLVDIETTAEKDGGDYVIKGEKAFVTNAAQADVVIILARTGDALSAFAVETAADGISAGEQIKTMGMRGAPGALLKLDGCRVGADNLLGGEGQGEAVAEKLMDIARLHTAAMSVGIARAAFEHGKEYAETRRSGGKPIGAYQEVAFKIAEMYSEFDTSRQLMYFAAWNFGIDSLSASMDISIAKLFASETAVRNANRAMQIFGGAGYTEGQAVERIYRDAKYLEIADGTSEVLRMSIADEVIGEKV